MGIIAPILALCGVLLSVVLCGSGCAGDLDNQYSSYWGPDGNFSWASNALSDLGVSKVANIFNYSLILAGILNVIFCFGFLKAYRRDLLSYIGNVILLLASGSISLVGIFTEAFGSLHFYVSFGFFIFSPIAMIIIGVSFTRNNLLVTGCASVIAGLIALATISSYFTELHLEFGLGFAVPEMVVAIIISGWLISMALIILTSKTHRI